MAVIQSLLHLIAAVLSNNSRFSKEWKAGVTPSSAGTSGIEGRWEGLWRSHSNGHQGKLKGIFRKVADSEYEVLFRAKFAKVLTVSYQVVLNAVEQNHRFILSGSTDLGWLAGGIYRYQGTVDNGMFSCHYECKYDQGEFSLHRIT